MRRAVTVRITYIAERANKHVILHEIAEIDAVIDVKEIVITEVTP